MFNIEQVKKESSLAEKGLARLERRLCEEFRLLIGRQPDYDYGGDRIDLKKFYRRKLQGDLEVLPFDPKHARMIDEFLAFLKRDSVDAKLFRKSFLHAKAYIFDELAIVGSSNFTPYGLTRNSELNLVRKERAVADSLRDWFDDFWAEAEEYKDALIDILEASKFGSKPYTPYELFIKVLYEYFKGRLLPEAAQEYIGVDLASFQQEGLQEAIRILNRHRGVLIADAVGLGKTYIGMGLLEHYLLKRRRPGHIPKGLVICPAQLRELLWEPKLSEYGLKAEIRSQEEIGRRDFEWKAFRNHDLVLVDECHNFRNPVTQRHQHLARLIATGNRNKLVVLITATPINNTIWDLYHQLMLITRGSDTYFNDWGISNLQGFFRRVDQGAAEIFDLLEETTVRRSRYDIRKRQGAGEKVILPGKGEIRFPERELESVSYDLEAAYQGFYKEIAAEIEALSLVAYNIEQFKRDSEKLTVDRNNALIGILKTLWLKRLESSVRAFAKSIHNQQRFQRRFFALLLENRLLSSADYRKILALETEERPDTTIDQLIESLSTVSVADYDLRAIRRHLETDLSIFDSLLDRLNKIQRVTQEDPRRDAKLESLKSLLVTELEERKLILFSYYQDTAKYLYRSLSEDVDWQKQAGCRGDKIGLITGDTAPRERERLVRRFAPRSNTTEEQQEERRALRREEIQILISTDVLSEGQNLQDAGVCVNYDLHWNPVRMIQRAGRIDRLGSDYEQITIYNFFPEEDLEELLGLVNRLQDRIADIDRTVGLDASVLGETISPKSLEDLKRLKARDQQLVEELEQVSELISVDEMKLPLIACLQQLGEDRIKEIPLGIHSGKRAEVSGVFFAFQARDRHFWRFYPFTEAKDGPPKAITDKRKLFHWIQCSPETERSLPEGFSRESIFPLLERATQEILADLSTQVARRKIREPLKGFNLKFYNTLNREPPSEEIPEELRGRLNQVLEEIPLKPFERDPTLKSIWANFQEDEDASALAESLDAFFVEHELYRQIVKPTLEQIEAEDLQLICYEILVTEE